MNHLKLKIKNSKDEKEAGQPKIIFRKIRTGLKNKIIEKDS